MSNESLDGATHHQRLLAAAREDNEEVIQDVFQHEGEFDINFQDGASHGSTSVLEHILSHEDCDVDPINYTQKATPLHLAMLKYQDSNGEEEEEFWQSVVESLLEAGADTTIKDKNGDTALDLVPSKDQKTKDAIRRARAQAAFSADDVVNKDDESDEGSEGSMTDDDS